jgi:hypothetical protein
MMRFIATFALVILLVANPGFAQTSLAQDTEGGNELFAFFRIVTQPVQ